jgi:hypothetical protein
MNLHLKQSRNVTSGLPDARQSNETMETQTRQNPRLSDPSTTMQERPDSSKTKNNLSYKVVTIINYLTLS